MPEFIKETPSATKPSGPRRGIPRVVWRLGMILLIFAIIPLALIRSFFVNIHPYQSGIKEVKIGVHRGIQNKIYDPGYAFIIPFGVEKMHLFPRNLQVLELSGSVSDGRDFDSHHYDRVAKIQTSDGFYVDVDVTILYRLSDPYKVMTTLGPGDLFLTNGVIPKAEPILKQTLGELRTEDFYNSMLRREKTAKACDMLNQELTPKGLSVDHVLVRYFRYSDEIQKNIEAKKLQDQLVFKNQAEARAAIEEASLKRVTQEGEMRVKVTLQEGEAYKVQKTADKDLYMRKKAAEGLLLVRQAEAGAVELKNEAMQVGGYDRKVAMSMADVLKGMDTIIVPSGADGINPMDLDSMLKLFGVRKETSAGPAPAASPATHEGGNAQ